ncbi:nucleoside-diphosphate sugar epimerase/dehydratase [Saxibacter everestensis]|uniref:Nucleoside-diphosphate sugar epimerase/dehydratase n=1 Tax=Saxibacter everestensis TaxID=2909229 RepID=A0ABY8QTL6_9MICO|nr:nucleoside-diphosphate sugar epimerase/dehydratase [Brevibacteriaceae bacterium ZFBP1038]
MQTNSPAVRFAVQGLLDALAWLAACLLATLIAVGYTAPWPSVFVFALMAIGLQLLIGAMLFLYQNRYPYGGFAETRFVAISAALVGICLQGVELISRPGLGQSTVIMATLGAVVLMSASRHAVRMYLDRWRRPAGGSRVVIVGAGEAGAILIRQMLHTHGSTYLPVALIDDDHAKRNLQLSGVPVKGTSAQLFDVAKAVDAEGIIVAIAEADSRLLRLLSDQVAGTGIWIRTLPPLEELVNRRVDVSSIRDLNVEDLIGRQPVETDMARIREHVQGKTVLVTGAGGSIGSELCRQLHRLYPAELIMLDRDESGLHAVQLSIYGRALLDSSDVVLADIRDAETMKQIFADRRPDVVFHAAALKHLPMLEQYPLEGWKTNVHGSLNVLRAAANAGVSTFVNISTDKAANPTSVLGQTKRIAEQLTSSFAESTGQTYLSVRFGNVLGSRGSVLYSFEQQLKSGGPLTITHPDVTRYFMTIPEACQLVLQAAVIGGRCEALVLDMGEAVRIVDIAERLIAMSHKHCQIVFTGLRPGEKLDEDLFTEEEMGMRTSHEKISHVTVPPLLPESLPETSAVLPVVRDFLLDGRLLPRDARAIS